jgi:hypothetical protein
VVLQLIAYAVDYLIFFLGKENIITKVNRSHPWLHFQTSLKKTGSKYSIPYILQYTSCKYLLQENNNKYITDKNKVYMVQLHQ